MGRRSSINYEHGIFGLAYAGRRTDGLVSDSVVSHVVTCQSNGGHQANETQIVSSNQGLVPWIVQAGARGRWWLFLPMSII